MTYPADIGVIDMMLDIPDTQDRRYWYEFMKDQLRDEGSKTLEMPAGYMFKNIPHFDESFFDDPVARVVEEMDKHGVDQALIGCGPKGRGDNAFERFPGRFHGSFQVQPNEGMKTVFDLVKAYETQGVAAATAFPSGYNPQVPINDKKMFPIYAKCAELGIPIFVCSGVPGPRFGMDAQYVGLIDEVCWYFPELIFVTRHGCEPWEDLMVKLMLKWPNLYYSTSAFAPKYYPKAIVDYANTRGADKVMYAGYFPMGLSLDRIFTEMPNVAFKDEVWPKFLRDNARKVLGLD